LLLPCTQDAGVKFDSDFGEDVRSLVSLLLPVNFFIWVSQLFGSYVGAIINFMCVLSCVQVEEALEVYMMVLDNVTRKPTYDILLLIRWR
jgi:uncharacterized membrane protein